MKKICFLIFALVGISAKSNALDFSEVCELFYHNASANMTINFDNGTSVPISTSSMMEICQGQYGNNSWMSDPVTNFSLAMIGATTAVAIPCLQFIGGYVYNRWCRGQSIQERLLTEIDARTTVIQNSSQLLEELVGGLVPAVTDNPAPNAPNIRPPKLDRLEHTLTNINDRLAEIEGRLPQNQYSS